jgi:hypothetical protein
MRLLLRDKPLHIRKRTAVIATGSIAIVLLVILIYVYVQPYRPHRDLATSIGNAYTTILLRLQSHFHAK